MAKKKPQGHTCKICGERKSNESFSGKGHAAHICKACSEQQSEQMTLNRLANLPARRLTGQELKWLQNRTRDRRPQVRELAQMVYAARFPYAERNARKRELVISQLELSVRGEIPDEYGDPVWVQESYLVVRKPATITRTMEDGSEQTAAPPPGELAKLFKWAVHTLEIFCWDQEYLGPADADGEEETVPTWSVSIEYGNGEIQEFVSTNAYIPENVALLCLELSDWFE